MRFKHSKQFQIHLNFLKDFYINTMERKCLSCKEDISHRFHNVKRCTECQNIHKKTYKKASIKKDIKLNTKEYLHQNKPNLIAFLEAYESKRYEDIDLLFCDEFIEYIGPFYFLPLHKKLSLIDEMNHLIIKIIADYTKPD